MASQSVEPFLQGLLLSQTDRLRCLVACSTAMWPNNRDVLLLVASQEGYPRLKNLPLIPKVLYGNSWRKKMGGTWVMQVYWEHGQQSVGGGGGSNGRMC